MPCGHFTLEKHGNSPLVLVAAGVGITPIMSILDSYGEKFKKGENIDQKIICIQSKKSPARHLMKDRIDELVGAGLTESHVFYTRDSGKTANLKNTKIHHGRITLESIRQITEEVLDTAEFYFWELTGARVLSSMELDDQLCALQKCFARAAWWFAHCSWLQAQTNNSFSRCWWSLSS